MKILAIETATYICGVAYINDSNCVNLVERECPRTSAEELPGMVKNVKKKSGFEWEDIRGVLSKIEEECKELTEAVNEQESIHEMGDLLLVMVNLCRWMNIQAEDALRQANARFSLRYIRMEELALASGKIFSNLPLAEKEEFWQQAKLLER